MYSSGKLELVSLSVGQRVRIQEYPRLVLKDDISKRRRRIILYTGNDVGGEREIENVRYLACSGLQKAT